MITAPQSVSTAMGLLSRAGYKAYLAGGCVRDSLLGKTPADWDIATNAPPEQSLEVFAQYRTIPTGLKHGTITVIINSDSIEITTFRIDGAYSDNRRPDSVTFTDGVREDLSRRDFTINAMAWNPAEGLIDPYGGHIDLLEKKIRCVGDAATRFREDGLRILRGARFACTQGFSVDAPTKNAMLELRGLLDNIAAERIAAELCKALTGDGFTEVFLDMPELLLQIIPELSSCVGFDQSNPAHCYDVFRHTLEAVSAAPGDLTVRLALLLHDAAKPARFKPDKQGIGHFKGHAEEGAALAGDVLSRLRFDNAAISRVRGLVLWHDTDIPANPGAVKRWLGRLGEEGLGRLFAVMKADNAAKNPEFGEAKIKHINNLEEITAQILSQRECFCLADLAVSGSDLIAAGYQPGPE
ncbi:MAG: CCA tRNA nucleotidyltransferase, partial [Oscillospiraceae bacterium]|nr:CCA tRNA nucleotidyltransferase [Oscillospiraceae bacterium]